jgi:hypothetical protein
LTNKNRFTVTGYEDNNKKKTTFISCATTVSRADPALNALARAICNAKIYIDILG